MREHIQRVLAPVKSFLAKLCFCFFIFLAEFKLKASALHVLICSFVYEHLTFLL